MCISRPVLTVHNDIPTLGDRSIPQLPIKPRKAAFSTSIPQHSRNVSVTIQNIAPILIFLSRVDSKWGEVLLY